MFRNSIAGLGVAVTVVAMSTLAASPAWAKAPTKTAGKTGIDISYAQCSSSLPAGEAFAVVGVNGGLANDYNPCLASEFSYAQTSSTGASLQAKAQTYLNTADPGNAVADWPSPSQEGAYGSKATPDGSSCGYAPNSVTVGADSVACAYVYGYDMVAGIAYSGGSQILGDITAFSQATNQSLVAQPVWLDVETANSWQSGSTGLSMNVADLQGMVQALRDAATAASLPTPQIGVYSTSYQWGQITGLANGGAGNLAGLPDWIPGARGQSGAASNCSLAGFTGTVPMTQWFGHPYDGDYSCIG